MSYLSPPTYTAVQVAEWLRRVAATSETMAVRLAFNLEAEAISQRQELPGFADAPWDEEILPPPPTGMEEVAAAASVCSSCARRRTREGRLQDSLQTLRLKALVAEAKAKDKAEKTAAAAAAKLAARQAHH